MLTNFDQQIIPNYSPISAKGGRRTRARGRRSMNVKTRRHKKSNTRLKNGRRYR
jgi:hypothetical protein